MEQLEPQTGFRVSARHSSQPWGGFIIFWGQRSVPSLGSQIEFPDPMFSHLVVFELLHPI